MTPKSLSRLFRLCTLAVIASAAPDAAAQEAMRTALISQEDSTRLVAAARSDQTQFERIRRNRLTEAWAGGSSRCDERIGRFCLTHGRGRADWVAPPEHPDVVAARLTLVDGLGQVAELLPGDGWIAGQRVRYLVEARRFDEAVEAARDCRAERSWCSALAGFAYHHAARAEQADSAYAVALMVMRAEERDAWLDITQILDDRSVRAYRRMSPADRAQFEGRFWHLADPLLTQPGNELRAEHFTRHVWDQLQFRASSTDGISWGHDLREILIRFGWPAGYERVRDWGMSLTQGPPSLISHYGGAPQDLLPPWEALLGEDGTDGVWDVESPTARTGYNLPMEDSVARWFHPLANQIATFRRAGDAIVVAGYELPRDSVPADADVVAGLGVVATGDTTAVPTTVQRTDSGLWGALQVRAPADALLASIEVLVPTERRIARARYGIDLAPLEPGLIAVSDLLLLQGDLPLPDSLSDAVDAALGSARVTSGQQVGLYWEIYNVDPATSPELTFSLRLLEGRTGWLRRLAERAGLLREVAPVRLRWQEPTTEGPFMPRSLTVQVPELAPGTYTLELTVEAPGREPLTVRKDVEVAG